MDMNFKTCPQCRMKSIVNICDDYHREDGVVIPQLSRWQCSSCQAFFFDDAAIRRIEEKMQKAPSKGFKQIKQPVESILS